MKSEKYLVEFSQSIEVEAEDEMEAIEKAQELLDDESFVIHVEVLED